MMGIGMQGDQCTPKKVVMHSEFGGGGRRDRADHLVGGEDVGWVIEEVGDGDEGGISDFF
jgi:hypothetical protein